MIYLVSFGIFCVFIFFLSLGLIFKRGGLKSESEAHEILEGISCAMCSNSGCGFHGQKNRKPTKNCLTKTEENLTTKTALQGTSCSTGQCEIGFKEV